MTDTATRHQRRPVIAHSLRILAVPIILFWIVVAVGVNVLAPQLEVVGEQHSAPMAPEDAPSMQAMKRMGANFKEFNSNSTVMIIVEGQQPLGPDAHQFYDEIIRKLRQDPEHIQHIQDFWGDTLTAAGAQSPDGKASYVMLTSPASRARRWPTKAFKPFARSSRTPKPRQGFRLTSQARPHSPTICTSSATPAWPRSRCSLSSR
jgi:predicted RND superfamily exporter protein